MRKIKIFIYLIFSLFLTCITCHTAEAVSISISYQPLSFGGVNISAFDDLLSVIYDMVYNVSESSHKLMEFASLLICNSLHGAASYTTFSVMGLVTFNVHLLALDIFISGLILYVIGFFIMLMSIFYMFDIAFTIATSVLLLPLALALWPFAWTRSKFKSIMTTIVYYTGLFIFLPLGIEIAVEIAMDSINSIVEDGSAVDVLFKEDKAELIREQLGLFTVGFLRILICYIIAVRIIPLLADKFCSHFFDGPIFGGASNPIKSHLTTLTDTLKKRTLGRFSKYSKDVAKHQTGEAIAAAGDKKGNWGERILYNYGKSIAKTKKK